MKLFKYIALIIIILTTLIRCTEVYEPDISSATSALVVEGLITDEEGPFTIKLTLAKPLPYDSLGGIRFVVMGAKVKIIDNQNNIYSLTEKTPGNYVTPDGFKTEIGKSYKLNIAAKDGNTYESKMEKLLPSQTYDSLRAIRTYENYINEKSELQNVVGADFKVDLFSDYSKTDTVPACRFHPVLTYQYWYTYRDRDINGNEIMSYHWNNFGWKTYIMNMTQNMTDEKAPSNSPLIKNHSVCFVPFDALSYAIILPPLTVIYYLKIDQYTLNHDSYRFYKSANSQLSASGKIFDPVNSQLYGNMRCINNPSKNVLGLFEVSSVKKKAVKMVLTIWNTKVNISDVAYIDIPANNDFQYMVWDLMTTPPTDPAYGVIPLPDWWNHN